MVSFCDIPVQLSREHRSKYGEYGIGIDKQKLIAATGKHLSPVHYVIDDWPIVGAYKHHKDYVSAHKRLDSFVEQKRASGAEEISVTGPDGMIHKGYACVSGTEEKETLKSMNIIFHSQNYANYALGITKNYICKHNGKDFCAYDECEWRIVIPEDLVVNGNETKWFWSKSEFDEWKKERGNTFIDGYIIELEPDCINRIIVPTEIDKAALLEVLGKDRLLCNPNKIVVTTNG